MDLISFEGDGLIPSHWLQERVAQDLQIQLNDQQLKQFAQYYELLITTNQKFNLTAITEEREVYIKHFYDSLTLAKVLTFDQLHSLIDIGTGAGFPGIPLKIAFPHLKVVLMDSLQKRVRFLQTVVTQLGLQHVTCLHGRAEDMGHETAYRQQFDLATARAVAKLNVLAEYCLPFVKVGGHFIAMKGSSVREEIEQARNGLKRLGNATYQVNSFMLPENKGERKIIHVKKRNSTPKSFPRKAGTPKRQPL